MVEETRPERSRTVVVGLPWLCCDGERERERERENVETG